MELLWFVVVTSAITISSWPLLELLANNPHFCMQFLVAILGLLATTPSLLGRTLVYVYQWNLQIIKVLGQPILFIILEVFFIERYKSMQMVHWKNFIMRGFSLLGEFIVRGSTVYICVYMNSSILILFSPSSLSPLQLSALQELEGDLVQEMRGQKVVSSPDQLHLYLSVCKLLHTASSLPHNFLPHYQ